jgi:hypothetical protein
MRFFNFILICLLLLFGVALEGYGQVTYTTDGSGGWIRTPLTGGCTEQATPPFGGIAGCPIIININHPITYAILTIGNNVTINVNSGGVLEIQGDLSQSSEAVTIININGGALNVGGNFNMASGTIGIDTNLNINIFSAGVLNIFGAVDMGNNSLINLDGDSSGQMIVGTIELAQNSIVNILQGGNLVSNGITRYNGNSSSINVYGFFRTAQVEIMGGKDHQLNTFGDAKVVIENDLVLKGDSQITFGGNSEIDIGGDIDAKGSAKVTVTNTANVYVCGEYPDPNSSNNTDEDESGKFNPSCRLLPVEYGYLKTDYLSENQCSIISWSTTKEWEASYFEVERAMQVNNFEKVGEVKATGWSDQEIDYVFEDKNLPLTGGNLLYRLKQVDLNGNFQYSQVLSVRIPGVEFTSGVWRAYPNPTHGNELRVNLMDASLYNNETLTFRLIHPMVQTLPVTVASESEMNEALSDFSRRMPKGVFVVEIQWGQKVEHIKVLKQ